MASAKQGDTVKVHYTGKLDNGDIFDTSVNAETLEFTIGEKQLLADFENTVIGMQTGETKTVHIPAQAAYGLHNPQMVMEINLSQFPEDVQAEIGLQLQIADQNGNSAIAVITGVGESTATLDANHPLAGKDLTFDIQLVEIV